MSDQSFEELQHICRTLLDKADLDIALDARTSTITLHFYTDAEIVVSCMDWHHFVVSKSPEDQDGFFVGETAITHETATDHIVRLLDMSGWSWDKSSLPRELYHLSIHGTVDVKILCTKIVWERREASDNVKPVTDE